MIVPDGIEVYLKPAAKADENLKFPEFEHSSEQNDDGHYRRCYVPFSDAPFQIVVKFAEDFHMFTALDVLVGIGVSSHDSGLILDRIRDYHPIDQSCVAEYQYSFDQSSNREKTILRMSSTYKDVVPTAREKNLWPMSQLGPYQHSMIPGIITITVQRGTIIRTGWVDRVDGSIVGKNLPRCQLRCEPRSFSSLRSKNGRNYRFEFVPRSHECLMLMENDNSLKPGQPAPSELKDQDRFPLIADKEFSTARERTEALRVALEEGRHKPKKPQAISGRKAPLTCDCPKDMHGKQGRGKSISSKVKADRLLQANSFSKTTVLADANFTKTATSASDSDNEAAGVQSDEERTAKTCPRCKNLKKPPRGKKIAWRKRTGRWMYVAEHAPEEQEHENPGDVPSETGQPTVVAQDRDDEEAEIKSATLTPRGDVNMTATSATAKTLGNKAAESGHEVTAIPAVEDESQNSGARMPTDTATDPNAPATAPSRQPVVEISNGGDRATSLPKVSSATAQIEVDLTACDDDPDDIIFVKSEVVDRKAGNLVPDEDDGIEDMRYELREIEREKRKLELEAKEESIKRKIARHGLQKKQRVKEEIKIEH